MVPKLGPVDCERLARFFEHHSFTRRRQKGSHVSMVKPGVARPLVIPMPGEVTVGVIMSNLRTAGLTRDDLHDLARDALSSRNNSAGSGSKVGVKRASARITLAIRTS